MSPPLAIQCYGRADAKAPRQPSNSSVGEEGSDERPVRAMERARSEKGRHGCQPPGSLILIKSGCGMTAQAREGLTARALLCGGAMARREGMMPDRRA